MALQSSIEVQDRTGTIELHAAPALVLSSPSFTSTTSTGDTVSFVPYMITRTPESQRLVYTFERIFEKGTSGVLDITFESSLASNFFGYYKCNWPGGALAATQFEVSLVCGALLFVEMANSVQQPVEARSAFPCFDEPALKATFAFTSVTRVGTVSLANMPPEHVSVPSDGDLFGADGNADEWVKTLFQTTPPVGHTSLRRRSWS